MRPENTSATAPHCCGNNGLAFKSTAGQVQGAGMGRQSRPGQDEKVGRQTALEFHWFAHNALRARSFVW